MELFIYRLSFSAEPQRRRYHGAITKVTVEQLLLPVRYSRMYTFEAPFQEAILLSNLQQDSGAYH